MLTKLFKYLRHEIGLIDELIILAEKQQKALISYDAGLLEEVTKYQDALAKGLKTAENQRVKFLTSTLKISSGKALSLKLSSLEGAAQTQEELKELNNIRNELNEKLKMFHEINLSNRMLTNRAMNSVREMLAVFSGGGRRVCNVTV